MELLLYEAMRQTGMDDLIEEHDIDQREADVRFTLENAEDTDITELIDIEMPKK